MATENAVTQIPDGVWLTVAMRLADPLTASANWTNGTPNGQGRYGLTRRDVAWQTTWRAAEFADTEAEGRASGVDVRRGQTQSAARMNRARGKEAKSRAERFIDN